MPITPYTKPAGQAPAPPSTDKKVSLLYVEDEDINWEITLHNLRERYNVERAVNALQAFEKLKNNSYHAVLMDIQLKNSDLDGVAITEILRGIYKKPLPEYAKGMSMPNVPIIFMTAYAARYTKSELKQHGGDELVTKPIDFTSLNLCLSRCLLRALAKPS